MCTGGKRQLARGAEFVTNNVVITLLLAELLWYIKYYILPYITMVYCYDIIYYYGMLYITIYYIVDIIYYGMLYFTMVYYCYDMIV